ncbi:MAGa3780 family membrane protein [Mycoplasma phocimorsus]|uniref:Uncharacterized protein n=1 Tax=Mycoplasma phocimorsus TaxID=3045839 RepID=A0AAJ1PSC9_9MOLU|nr:hypothetical protein [Mycoplasma phocimorsus]MDJ1645639.1 hypothetical protein [Mycoplasma phocimorsus]MDJ1646161.1 hypothetical protein [Mycoplasma phocimorsus]MDJ1646758.1 hypothetical protein [Mycoplasma phocimorsus]MDJ1647733.1 hypothetical protein [Mycoplasma phocimorsus]MDJ1648267.1 hypothetical protein [Mycoplasma phocimorsus]
MKQDNLKIIKIIFFWLFLIQIIYLISVSSVFGYFWETSAERKTLPSSNIVYTPELFKNGYYFVYFTTVTNLLLALSGLIFIIKPESVHRKRFFFISVTYMTITVLFYWSLISWNESARDTWENPLKVINTLFVHLIFYIQALVALFIFRKYLIMSYKEILVGVVGLWAYFVFTLCVFYLTDPHVVIYDFINFKKPLFIETNNSALRIFIIAAMIVITPFLSVLNGIILKAFISIKRKKEPLKTIK